MDKQEQLIATLESCKEAVSEMNKRLDEVIDSVRNPQEARVLTLEEIPTWKDSVWVEEKNGALYVALIKRIFNDRKVIALFDCSQYYETSSCEYCDYNKLERFWTSKPTPEQQKAVEWDAAD